MAKWQRTDYQFVKYNGGLTHGDYNHFLFFSKFNIVLHIEVHLVLLTAKCILFFCERYVVENTMLLV